MWICDLLLTLSMVGGGHLCNELMYVLCRIVVHFPKLISLHKAIKETCSYFERHFSKTVNEEEFYLSRLTSSSVLLVNLYAKYPIFVLKGQFSSSCKGSMISEPVVSHIFSPHMKFIICIHAARAAEHYFKKYTNQYVSWKNAEAYGEHSFVAAIQLFSDKSQISLWTALWNFILFTAQSYILLKNA